MTSAPLAHPHAAAIGPGTRVTVMGLGRFGGGLGVTTWLARRGAQILVTDSSSEHDLRNSLAELSSFIENGTIRLRLGTHEESDFTDADLVVANPAVPRPWSNRFLMAARDAGVPITTEIRLLVEQLDRSRVIGVTGSAGKSTTVSMIHHILAANGIGSHLGGNLGGSLLNDLDTIGDEDWVVLELSSFMLYWLGAGVGWDGAPGWSPHVAVLTNLTPNHLDWHESMEHYEASKRNIARWQAPDDQFIAEDHIDMKRPLPLQLLGSHNQRNGFFAIMACLRGANVFPPQSVEALKTFRPLPHRLESLGTDARQRTFVDDSKSTTPDATLLAIGSWKRPSTLHVIVGGYDKGSDLSSIGDAASRLGGLYCIGATGPAIAASSSAPDSTHVFETLAEAVETATARMNDGDTLLLSPGCASWDQFTNFQERGAAFRAAVQPLL